MTRRACLAVQRVLPALLALLAMQALPAAAQATPPPCWTGIAFQECPTLSHNDLNNANTYAVQQGSAQALAAMGTATTPTPVEKTVFIGSVQAGYATLINPALHPQLLAAGNVGLYQHANGNATLTAAQRTALWATWGVTGVTPTGQGTTVGEVGPFAPVSAGYAAFFGGSYPAEANMNISYGTGATPNYTASASDAKPGTAYTLYMSASDLATAEAAFSAAIAAGAKNIAAFVTPNLGGMDLDDSFATGAYWAPIRTLALFGGGLALDVPPTYWTQREPAYGAMLVQMILWCQANHLRSNVTVSPYAVAADASGHTGGDGYDPGFQANLEAFVTFLALNNAMPSQWAVENYGDPNTTGNDIQTDGSRNDLTQAALYLARAVRTSPSGTTPAVANGIADAGLMVSTAAAPVVRAALPTTVRVGRIRMADVDGLGTLAADDRDNVAIIGGAISGPVAISTTRAISAAGGFTGGGNSASVHPYGAVLIGGAVSVVVGGNGGDLKFNPTAGAGGLDWPTTTIASGGLPSSGCVIGSMRYAVDARNPGEAAGAGTGAFVQCNKAHTWLLLTGGAVAN